MRREARYSICLVAVAFCLKLWLLSGVRTIALFAPHDASNFLDHASSIVSGHWFGPYGGLTLIKQPFYPIYLAVVQEFGLTLTNADICLDLLTAVVVTAAVAPLIRSSLAKSVLFIAIFFEPVTLTSAIWVTDRNTINPDLAILVLACAAGWYTRRSHKLLSTLPWIAGLSLALSAFWLNREDAVWITIGLIAFATAIILFALRQDARSKPLTIALLAIPPVACSLFTLSIIAINAHVYGWGVTNEQQAPEFVAAYNSLTSIDVPKSRYIPLPKSARLLAYRVSSAARELQPSFEGSDGSGWTWTTCGTMPELCDSHDIGGGWAEWAFRDAVINAGHYHSAPDARAFYLLIASQIDGACADGRLHCRPKGRSVFPPPITPGAYEAVMHSVHTGIATLVGLTDLEPGTAIAPDVDSPLRMEYDFVARSVSDPGIHVVNGWILYNHAGPIKVVGPGSGDAVFVPLPSPDVAAATANVPGISMEAKSHARFHLTSECDEACSLQVLNARGETVLVPLRDDRPAVDIGDVHLRVDASSNLNQFDNEFKLTTLRLLTRAYRLLFEIGLPLMLVLLVCRCIRSIAKRRRRYADASLYAFAATLACTAYLALLCIIDALSFNVFGGRYMATIEAVMIAAVAVLIVRETQCALRLARLSAQARAKRM